MVSKISMNNIQRYKHLQIFLLILTVGFVIRLLTFSGISGDDDFSIA